MMNGTSISASGPLWVIELAPCRAGKARDHTTRAAHVHAHIMLGPYLRQLHRQAEIAHAGTLLETEENVAASEVAVDDPYSVQVHQAGRDIHGNLCNTFFC